MRTKQDHTFCVYDFVDTIKLTCVDIECDARPIVAIATNRVQLLLSMFVRGMLKEFGKAHLELLSGKHLCSTLSSKANFSLEGHTEKTGFQEQQRLRVDFS